MTKSSTRAIFLTVSNGVFGQKTMSSIQFKITKKGEKIYYVVVPNGTRRKWLKAGSILNAGRIKKKIDSLAKTDVVEKLDIRQNTARIDAFFKEYAEHIELHNSKNSIKRYIGVLNTFLIFLNLFHSRVKYANQITPDIIESYQKNRLKSMELKLAADGEKRGAHKQKKLPKPQTVNYEIGVLRSAFIWAKYKGWISEVPTSHVKKLKPVFSKRKKILSADECSQFLKAADHLAEVDSNMRVYSKVFRFLLNTGLRSEELCNLTWDDIDLKSGLIKIQEKEGWSPKSYSREFFLNRASLDLLKNLRKRKGLVFSNQAENKLKNDDLRRALLRVSKFCGFEGFTRVHDLRHTFNSLMQMNGVDAATMGKILGHKDIETTMIYTHQTQEHLKKSIEKVGI